MGGKTKHKPFDPTPRPTLAAAITDTHMSTACELISAGRSLKEAAAALNVSVSMLWRALNSRGVEMYAHAREIRAADDEAKIAAVCDAVEKGTLAPDAARVVISGRQWLAERRDHRRYGAKQTQELTGKDGGPIQIAATDMRKLTDAELKQMEALASKAST